MPYVTALTRTQLPLDRAVQQQKNFGHHTGAQWRDRPSDERKCVWQSYADFLLKLEYGIFPQEHRGLSGQMPCRLIQADLSDHNFIDPVVPETVLALPLESTVQNRWSWDMGNGWRHANAVPGHLLVLPAGVESRWRVQGDASCYCWFCPRAHCRACSVIRCQRVLRQRFIRSRSACGRTLSLRK
jgi:hypothetical protein